VPELKIKWSKKCNGSALARHAIKKLFRFFQMIYLQGGIKLDRAVESLCDWDRQLQLFK